MKLSMACGICDFSVELEEITAAQVELQWDLYTARHTHTPEELEHYINARAQWIPDDGVPNEEPGEDTK